MGVGVGACDLFDPEQGMVHVESGGEAVDAVNLGLVLDGPAGGGWGFGASIVVCRYCALLVQRGFFAFGVCKSTILDFGVSIGFVVVGEGVLVVFGYA